MGEMGNFKIFNGFLESHHYQACDESLNLICEFPGTYVLNLDCCLVVVHNEISYLSRKTGEYNEIHFKMNTSWR